MRNLLAWIFFCLVVAVPGIVAQTTVTTSGGATNTVPLFTGTSTLGNSAIAQSSGGNVGIGTTAPLQKLTIMTGTNVYGAVYGGYGTSTANGDIVLGKTPFFELVGDGTLNDGPGVGLVQLNVGNSSTWASAAELYFGGTRAATASAAGTGSVGNTDILGRIGFFGDDGTNLRTRGAAIDAEVYTANTPVSTGTIPAALNLATYFNAPIIFYTNALTAGAGLNSTPLVGNANEKMRINANGNVGIGTTAPAFTLDVAGQIRSSSGGIVFPDGTTQTTAYTQVTAGSNVITESNGNVGIGTTSPGAKLDVEGGSIVIGSGALHVPGGGDGVNPPIHFLTQAPAGFNPGGNIGIWLANGGLISANAGMSIGGNVGIGTTAPDKPLYVNGGIHLNMPGGINWSSNQSLLITNSVDATTGDTGAQIWHGDGGAGGSHTLIFSSYPQTSAALTGGYMVLNTATGNVGIDTVNPSETLDTFGTVALGTLTERLWLGSETVAFNRRASTGAIYNPSAYAYQFQHTESTSPISDYLALQVYAPSGAGVTSQALTVNGSGQVGIGTALILPDGTKQTTAWTGALCGGDYAESVDVAGARDQYEPGDVMVVDPASPGGFLKSAEPYSTLVAGIYSTKPGVVGRRSTDPGKLKDEVPMAVVGIVPAKVSAENGPVKPGDLLVTSSTPGYAMKGTDRERITGAIVGKALGSVQNGAGIIEVLVTLQ